MLPSPINDDGSNSLLSTPSIPMDSDQLTSSFANASATSAGSVSNTTIATATTTITTLSATNSNSVSAEKIMQPPEELPYFPEKWPNKVCALCCLGERSQMGQGEMLRIEVSECDPKPVTSLASIIDSSQLCQEEGKNPRSASNAQTQLSNRRQKGLNKCK